MNKYDVIVVGCGYAGAVSAERFASIGKSVLVIDKRKEIAGNMFDYKDENGVNVHKYGPHIFHTNRLEVVEYLSNFTEWYPYEHRVLGYVDGQFVPVPFNLKSIEMCFDEKTANEMKKVLIETYGMEKKVTILELKKHENEILKKLADFVYDKVFKDYTMKQWGLTVDELDPMVTNRVPVHISYDDRYFQDKYQQMPKEGYTKIFEKMLNHPNIEVRLNTEALSLLKIDVDLKTIHFNGEPFEGKLIYTGAIDELLDYRFGALPYRSLDFDLQSHKGVYQAVGTVNYPTPKEQHGFTRITEYKHMMEKLPENTSIAVEYSLPYDRSAEKGNIPYYPIFTEDNQKQYQLYVKACEGVPNFYLLGRLAEYQYYNMDAIIYRSLQLFDKIK